MSDNDDILGDDLGDQSLADYNLGNEEEEQLLADDYDNTSSQNVPGRGYRDNPEVVDYSHRVEYTRQVSLEPYQAVDSECVVPNVTIEVTHTNVSSEHHANYAPYGEVPVYEQEQHAVVPPAIPAAPMESPQIVPSEMPPHSVANVESMPRERFPSERPPGVQRTPQVRDIPDSLDKVYVPRNTFGRGQRTTWRNPQYQPRNAHPYRRHYVNRGHFLQQQPKRPSFPPQAHVRSSPPHLRPESSQIRLEAPQLASETPEQPIIPPELPPISGPVPFRPMNPQNIERSPFQPNPNFPQRFPSVSPMQSPPNFRPDVSPPRPAFPPNMRTPYDPRPQIPFQFQQRPQFNPRPQFPIPAREIVPNSINHMPQVTIRQSVPLNVPPGVPPLNTPSKIDDFPPKLSNRPPEYNPREPEVRMLPVQLPTSLPPGGLAGKKVLINPHFKGNFQPPVEGLATYIPTRIQKSPPISPSFDTKYGAVQNVDDAAERFIAEQRNALARAATRKYPRRSPQRYIENTTIEIENELAREDRPRRDTDDADLLRRQEEFINANRAGLRRRMRSPSPVARRSPSPRRSLSPRRRPSPLRHHETVDEESEYRRRLREQESLRERVLRAKEVRRKKNAVALQKQIQDRERERQQQAENVSERQTEIDKDRENKPKEHENRKFEVEKEPPPRDRSPLKQRVEIEQIKDKEMMERKQTENLTPPRKMAKEAEVKKSPERALTPPLPAPDAVQKRRESKEKVENKSGKSDESALDFEDDLDLLLGDIDGILSDDEDTGRFKEKSSIPASPPKPKPTVDLRQKLPPKTTAPDSKPSAPRQKIVYEKKKEEKKKQERTPPKKRLVTSSTNTEENVAEIKNKDENKKDTDTITSKQRQRIIFGAKAADADDKVKHSKTQVFNSRRVVLQRKATVQETRPQYTRIEKTDPSRPNAGIFSRAVKKAIGGENTRVVVKNHDEPKVVYEMDSDPDEEQILGGTENLVALVTNLPHGMTETRLRTLAGDGVQSVALDKQARRARVAFGTPTAAEAFRKKFNNKMVAASKLSVVLN